ncbi:MAG: outer membrane protein assembly factor BamD [Phycisphaerales bacterium]|nr:outer membrane protein assembly factor BamD [Phycisphaerales bacterium]
MPQRSFRSASLRPLRGLRVLLLFALLTPAARAQSTYQLDPAGDWVQTSAPDPATDEGRIAEARRLIAEGKASRAEDILDEFIEKYQLKDNPWLPEAYLARGDAKNARGREEAALYDYEEVIKSYAGSDAFPKAVEREMDIGVRYLNGLRRRFLGMRLVSGDRVGEELLIRVQERLPGSRIAESANLQLADFYYRNRDLRMAAEAYDVFLINYPKSEFREKAMQRRVYANVARFKGPRYDASGLVEAEILVNDFVQRAPADAERAGMNDALLARIDDSLALQLLDTAQWYLRRKDEVSAKLTLNRLIRRHPLSSAARQGIAIMEQHGWTPPPAPGPVMEPPAAALQPAATSSPPPGDAAPAATPSPATGHPDITPPGQVPAVNPTPPPAPVPIPPPPADPKNPRNPENPRGVRP